MNIKEFRNTVEGFLSQTGITATAFGRKFAGDPQFVFQLREGREPRESTRAKVLKGITSIQSEAAA